ncbi:MAG TPA: vitamin K epoxide reductase family protein [Acidimicrobiales bacterium]|nr:vitamin K epoxide reductase family protein [Acidimicrobiales bacterium]
MAPSLGDRPAQLKTHHSGGRRYEEWDDEPTWERHEPVKWWGWTAFLLSLAGFGVSLYLTVDHFQGTVPICAANGIVDCAKVTTSPQSEIFGVLPVAVLGLIFYTALVGINVPPLWSRGGEIGRLLSYARLALAVIGIGTVFYLLYAELFSIKAICLWCTGIHVITFSLFVLVFATSPRMLVVHRLDPDPR